MGKIELPYTSQPPSRNTSRWPKVLVAILVLLATAHIVPHYLDITSDTHKDPSDGLFDSLPEVRYDSGWMKDAKCPVQPKPVYPKIAWNLTEQEREESLKKFSASVQIPTESFDDNGEPNDDPRWKPFFRFQEWLKETFPLAHETATVEYINTLGIVATFQGSDPSLKPLLLMSHYDVVPAPSSTFDRWTHAPFSGYNDGEYIWGRGSSDDKTLLVAQWESITHLLENGFKPRRTIIFSHGFDEEEVFARRGQGHIAPFLEERYGKNGLLLVIDEGPGYTDDFYGKPFALPAMGEKGYLDIKITVATAGGHSSVPPKHTGIGIASQIVNALESNPFPLKFTSSSPFLTALYCADAHAQLPKQWSKLLNKGSSAWPKLAGEYGGVSLLNEAEIRTTTAVDVINGGVKVNALPEVVTALVNFRIDFAESIQSTQDYVTHLLGRIAKHHDLAFSAFDSGNVTELALGGKYIKVETLGAPLEPAPRTPSSGGVWDLFAGTIKATFPGPDGQERIVTPYASTGNTDCKMYYDLSKNVYRFMGGRLAAETNAHTVDEKALIEAHFDIIAWIHAIIQNTDAYDGED